jgi:hypothetical protein
LRVGLRAYSVLRVGLRALICAGCFGPSKSQILDPQTAFEGYRFEDTVRDALINLWFPLVLGLSVVLVISISLCASLLPAATSSQRPLQQQITCELLLLTLNFISRTSTENPPLNCCI